MMAEQLLDRHPIHSGLPPVGGKAVAPAGDAAGFTDTGGVTGLIGKASARR